MNGLKQKRAASFGIVALIYILAIAAGIDIYHRLSFDWWLKLLIADASATVLTFAFTCFLPCSRSAIR